eukprot:CAMPEP_0195281164 /NCGR_PEP_ID=MMETSP0707-20130614/597_1 /TAXON_ID=33640 /ORGANISM="Asterionellopsis glacialis, Strain CCMP134" /LENGTH=347 /DNA_ID=CAMNT_0040340023 /DNA_START=106 /DNA_END=1149 /DNA_ORIENTATION=-
MPAASAPAPIYVDTQHDDMVHDAQLDYYGVKLATSSSDRTVKIYNVSSTAYEHAATLTGADGPVWQVSWAHPKFGVILACACFDGSMLIFQETRPRDWTLVHAAKQLHESSVNSVAFCPHEFGLMCAGASSDGRVSVLTHQSDNTWSVEYIRDNALGVNAVSWAPYGAYYGASSSNNNNHDGDDDDHDENEEDEQPRLVTGGCDNRIRFWIKHKDTGLWVHDEKSNSFGTEVSHTDWVRDVAWAPCILPNVNVVASCSEDRRVIIWTQTNGAGQEWKPTLLHTFDSPVWRLSWSVTGHMLAVSSGDNDVTLWKSGLDGVWTQMDTTVEESTTAQNPAAAAAPPPAQG